MKLFIKIAALVFLVQGAFIGQMFVTGIGGGVGYFLYGVPLFLISLILKLPAEIGGGFPFVAYLLFCIPAVFYSLLFGGIGSGIVSMIKRSQNKRQI